MEKQQETIKLLPVNIHNLPLSVIENASSRLKNYADVIDKISLGLGSNSRNTVSPVCWEYICIQFLPSAPQSRIIECVVDLRANDYMGAENGTHIFWFD